MWLKEYVYNFIELLDVCTTTSLTYSPNQDQYVFIHDAVLESLTCGDTQIPASGLAGAIEKLKQKDSETGMTGFETQFHVRVSCLCISTATKERPSILRAARSFFYSP